MKALLLRRLGYAPGTGFAIWLINTLFQNLFRLDSDCPVNKNFTTRVLHPQGLHIEADCPRVRRSFAVSGGCYINAADGLWIGSGSIWGANVAIVSQTHAIENLDDAPPTTGIRIGRNCWIGFGSVILPGVTLGDGTIVGANSVVRNSFPEGRVVIAGTPARVVRQIPALPHSQN
ncbi:acyltransferase [Ferrovibrio sp.]|uniref:acyltransferase n=1 Tax=Ferrovibrio sp. TaxID=1917215 RepID=UPI001B4065B8|nr:acyltransferase [Ferrovibrio sp.]MBP7063427.1 acyltransferase [Ferrovibrio sp.]